MNGDTCSPWLRRFARAPVRPRLRLICLPYAGGSAGLYRSWPAWLPPGVDLLAVQYPGREDRLREPPLDRVSAIAEALADELAPLLPDCPFAIFGHSLGALLAFETVRVLRRRGLPMPLHLFVSGAAGPCINTHLDDPRHLGSDDTFIAELRRMNGTAPELLQNAELMRLTLPTLRADLGAVDTYRYAEQVPLPVPIHALGGLDDDDVSLPKLRGWAEQTSVGFDLAMLAGDHFFLHHAAPQIIEIIFDALSIEPAASPWAA